MKRALLALCAVLAVASVTACGGDDAAESAPSATVGTVSTTTTTRSVEQEVEAAYLRSWDVYAEAVLTFDTSKLDEVYADRALEIVLGEVERLRGENTPIVVQVEHDTDVIVSDEQTATVVDTYVNRNYRVDGETRQPIDDTNDPGTYVERYTLRRAGESWRVVAIERQSYSPS